MPGVDAGRRRYGLELEPCEAVSGKQLSVRVARDAASVVSPLLLQTLLAAQALFSNLAADADRAAVDALQDAAESGAVRADEEDWSADHSATIYFVVCTREPDAPFYHVCT